MVRSRAIAITRTAVCARERTVYFVYLARSRAAVCVCVCMRARRFSAYSLCVCVFQRFFAADLQCSRLFTTDGDQSPALPARLLEEVRTRVSGGVREVSVFCVHERLRFEWKSEIANFTGVSRTALLPKFRHRDLLVHVDTGGKWAMPGEFLIEIYSRPLSRPLLLSEGGSHKRQVLMAVD